MEDEKETFSKEDVQKMLQAARIQQMEFDYGQQWFIEALAHTADLVNRGAFPPNAHEMGKRIYQQFMRPVAPPAEEKKEEKPETT